MRDKLGELVGITVDSKNVVYKSLKKLIYFIGQKLLIKMILRGTKSGNHPTILTTRHLMKCYSKF